MSSEHKISPVSQPRFFYGWRMVIASWIMVFLINAVAVAVFFKPMLEDFGWDRATLSSVQFVGLIIFTVASPFLGQIIDRFGPKLMILACVAPQVLSSAINGLATNIGHLYLARFLYGINVLSSTQILINRWFIKKRGMALGILATAFPFGSMVLAPFSQQLILLWGCRPTMFFWAGVTLVVMLPLALIIRNSPEDMGWEPDGKLLDSHRSVDPSSQPRIVDSEANLEAKAGLSFSQTIRTAPFWLLSLAHFVCGTGCGFMMTHIVIFATDMGYSDMIAVSLISVQGGLNLVGVLATGYLSDRMSRSKVLALTHFVRTLSFVTIVAFILLGGGSLWMLYTAMVFFGFGWYTTAPLTAGLVADLFGGSRVGTILGVTTSCHMLGMAIGAYAGGVIFELTGSYFLFFVVQCSLSLVATLFSLAIKPVS